MPIKDAKHPDYIAMLPRWVVLRDCYEGATAIKRRRGAYLPPNEGMVIDGFGTSGQIGEKRYQRYLMTALYENYVDTSIKTALGVMHHKPPEIELPSQLDPMRERATRNGDPLELLLMKLNQEQLITGRVGLLADYASTALGNQPPYLSMYRAENVINWDVGEQTTDQYQDLNLVVLDETEMVRNADFQWDREEKYRVLMLGDLSENEGTYRWAVLDSDQDVSDSQFTETISRGERLFEIPFVFVNSMDLHPEPQKPPLETLADLSLAIYRGDADYRQHLHYQAEDTLVTKGWSGGVDGEIRVGAGAHIELDAGTDSDAKFIGVGSEGLTEQREGLEDDRTRAQAMAGQILERSQVESGDALKRRMMQKHATITDVAKTGGEALQKILRTCARMINANPDEVLVRPNMDFSADQVMGADFNEWVAAKAGGGPISNQTLWTILKESGRTQFETYEDELAAMGEDDTFPTPATAVPLGVVGQ